MIFFFLRKLSIDMISWQEFNRSLAPKSYIFQSSQIITPIVKENYRKMQISNSLSIPIFKFSHNYLPVGKIKKGRTLELIAKK